MDKDLKNAVRRVLKTSQTFGADDRKLHAHLRALRNLRKVSEKVEQDETPPPSK